MADKTGSADWDENRSKTEKQPEATDGSRKPTPEEPGRSWRIIVTEKTERTIDYRWPIRLQDMTNTANKELGFEPPPPAAALLPPPGPSPDLELAGTLEELMNAANKEVGLEPPEASSGRVVDDQPISAWAFILLATAVMAAVVLMVFKGFDVLLAATQVPEGPEGVARAMGEYLRSLAPFIRITIGGIALGGVVWAFRRIRRSGRSHQRRSSPRSRPSARR